MLTRRPLLPRPRRGFSLIEVLVVISIIGVLAAISAGAMFRLRAAQTASNTEGTLSKLHGLMMDRWHASLDRAKKTVPSDLVDRCGGDKERAVAIWTYAVLKNDFPTTFAEANAKIDLGGNAVLQPLGIFKPISKPTTAYLATQTPTVQQQSAALFYAAITQGSGGGSAAGLEGSNQQVGKTDVVDTAATAQNANIPLSVYKDGWGTPVLFVRHASGGELNAPPYARANTVKVSQPNQAVKVASLNVLNMLDPQARISVWTGMSDPNPWLAAMQLSPLMRNDTFLQNQFSQGLGVTSTDPMDLMVMQAFGPISSGTNVLPTLVSAGANKKFGADPLNITADDSADNVLSYRLRREGDRGN